MNNNGYNFVHVRKLGERIPHKLTEWCLDRIEQSIVSENLRDDTHAINVESDISDLISPLGGYTIAYKRLDKATKIVRLNDSGNYIKLFQYSIKIARCGEENYNRKLGAFYALSKNDYLYTIPSGRQIDPTVESPDTAAIEFDEYIRTYMVRFLLSKLNTGKSTCYTVTNKKNRRCDVIRRAGVYIAIMNKRHVLLAQIRDLQ